MLNFKTNALYQVVESYNLEKDEYEILCLCLSEEEADKICNNFVSLVRDSFAWGLIGPNDVRCYRYTVLNGVQHSKKVRVPIFQADFNRMDEE